MFARIMGKIFKNKNGQGLRRVKNGLMLVSVSMSLWAQNNHAIQGCLSMHKITEQQQIMREAEYPIEAVILNRRSLRGMSGAPISKEQLMSLFEAARWAPSSHNSQPWRFFYALKDTENWQIFFDLLLPFNPDWAQYAGVLIIVVSKKTYAGKFSPTHSFVTGAACQNLALQGEAQHLVVHAIGGFNYQKAHEVLQLSNDYAVECMIAVGNPGLPPGRVADAQELETPTQRKPIDEFVFEGVHKITD